MKKLLIVAVLAFAGYKFYQSGFSIFSSEGAFDSQGRPQVVFFTGPGCGEHCEKVRSALQDRDVQFEEINIAGPDGAPADNKYGISNYPTTLIGNRQVLGDNLVELKTALAESLGREMLSRSESRLMDSHFDTQGRAQVVMYATGWCQYCKKQREFFADHNIAYKEVDVEASESNTANFNTLGGNGYPLIYVGYRRFSGFTEGALLKAIDELKESGPRV